ncbi:MAG: asparagine synthase [Deltaproteobacteria bacterium]
MSAIAGIFAEQRDPIVRQMLSRMEHRGQGGIRINTGAGATLGVIPNDGQTLDTGPGLVEDRVSDQHYALAGVINGRPLLERDALGVVPLYYGWMKDGVLCFASEVKGLVAATSDVHELPAGCRYDGETLDRYYEPGLQPALGDAPDRLAAELRRRLEKAIQKRILTDEFGCFLSGGLDSSVMAALARPHVKRLWTVAAGVAGAPDLIHAREVADFIKSDHREVVVTRDDMVRVLPDVIRHLESFDALLVRSSIMHYFAAGQIRRYAKEALSGEGGDELFAGYAYLKDIPRQRLAAELITITKRLSNTALQRVDRCGGAHGLRSHVCFLEPDVVDLALQIPVDLKLREGVEKWILREAVSGLLPESVLHRPKAKFWEGAGVQNLMAEHASTVIYDADFAREKTLPNGWVLGSKEELFYYRIFREQLGSADQLEWMGRTPIT